VIMSFIDELWPRLRREGAYVAGRWIDAAGRATINVIDPANGSLVGRVPDLGCVEMHTAIEAAQAALPGWRSRLPQERADILRRLHDLMLANREPLAQLMTREQGKPLAEASGEIEYAASFVRWFAEEGPRAYGETIPSHLPKRKLFVQRDALGVVGLVTPWNFPSAMLTRKLAAALAAGCTAVAVPSRETPFSALALAVLGEEAGIPPGVFSVLTGSPDTLVGEICRHPGVRGLSFTGSTEVGRLLMEKCAPTIKRVSLELGGQAPFIVFADAALDSAVQSAVVAKFQTTGQDCLAANRIFVHHSIYEPFLDGFARDVAALRVGPGGDPDVEIGPLINEAALAKSEQHVADALAKGARLVVGGKRHKRGGLFFEPTVLADVAPGMKIMEEETFGPVAAVLPFFGERDVVEAANATDYGLVAYLFTRDLARAHRVADALEFGMVSVNAVKLTGPPIPFGGMKQSGLGREGSRHGIAEYTEIKYVCLSLEEEST